MYGFGAECMLVREMVLFPGHFWH